VILVLFFLEFFFYFLSRRDLNPDRRIPVSAVTAKSNVSTLKPIILFSKFSTTATTTFATAALDDDEVRSVNSRRRLSIWKPWTLR
jgi:hypothetical protein